MNKIALRTWQEAREVLRQAAGNDVAAAFDRELAAGRKISAIRILREHGVPLEADRGGSEA